MSSQRPSSPPICSRSALPSASQCMDGKQNGDEAGVDCGGSCPNTCPAGSSCKDPKDCGSGMCSSGFCARKCVVLLLSLRCVSPSAHTLAMSSVSAPTFSVTSGDAPLSVDIAADAADHKAVTAGPGPAMVAFTLAKAGGKPAQPSCNPNSSGIWAPGSTIVVDDVVLSDPNTIHVAGGVATVLLDMSISIRARICVHKLPDGVVTEVPITVKGSKGYSKFALAGQ